MSDIKCTEEELGGDRIKSYEVKKVEEQEPDRREEVVRKGK